MAWSTPNTATPGDVLSASNYNQYVRDDLVYLFSGRLLGSVVRVGAADYTTTITTFADVDAANLIITGTVNSGRAFCYCSFELQADNTVGSAANVDVVLDSVTRAGHATYGLARVSQNRQLAYTILATWTALSVGSHTFKLQFRNEQAGATATIKNNLSPVVMKVFEL